MIRATRIIPWQARPERPGFSAAVRNYALKAGFYMIEQTGDTVKTDAPTGFKPREWQPGLFQKLKFLKQPRHVSDP
jgi:hypothetical protein